MDAVFDASALIFSLKVQEFFSLLEKRFSGLLVPDAVYDEVVVAGQERGAPEVQGVAALFSKKFLVRVKEKPLVVPFLGLGEREALAVAQKRGVVCLSDDRKAYQVGLTIGVKVISLPALVISSVRKKLVPKQKARELIDALVENGYYLKPVDYLAVLKAIE